MIIMEYKLCNVLRKKRISRISSIIQPLQIRIQYLLLSKAIDTETTLLEEY